MVTAGVVEVSLSLGNHHGGVRPVKHYGDEKRRVSSGGNTPEKNTLSTKQEQVSETKFTRVARTDLVANELKSAEKNDVRAVGAVSDKGERSKTEAPRMKSVQKAIKKNTQLLKARNFGDGGANTRGLGEGHGEERLADSLWCHKLGEKNGETWGSWN